MSGLSGEENNLFLLRFEPQIVQTHSLTSATALSRYLNDGDGDDDDDDDLTAI
jgi:hypothetical protein